MLHSVLAHIWLVLFFVSPLPHPLIILQNIPVNLTAVFKSLVSLHEAKWVTHRTSNVL